MAVYNPFDFFLEAPAEFYPFNYEPGVAHDLAPYLKREAEGPLFEKLLAGVDRGKQPTIDFLVALNVRLQNEIAYLVRMEPGVQSPEETLMKASGFLPRLCVADVPDSALLWNRGAVCSGYLIQLKPDVKSLDGPSGAEKTLRIYTLGPKRICLARDGSVLTPLRGSLPARVTFRSPARRSRLPPRPSPARQRNAR